MKKLGVWRDRERAGELLQDQHGALGFTYDEAWLARSGAPALSISLPKRPGNFNRKECRPFFGGLLPEERQRELTAKVLALAVGNDFGLLERLGGEVAGAIQFLSRDECPLSGAPRILEPEELAGILKTLPNRPLLAGMEGLRLSLAGAQTKLPLIRVGNRLALPAPNQPTTHILKLPVPGFPGTVENEAFAMRLGAGFGAAAVEPGILKLPDSGPIRYLLVERYDRSMEGQIIRRLHQEDFCQAMGIPTEQKYAVDGGPGLGACFALLRKISVRPEEDLMKLLDAVLFNLVLGNADAHGKNFSLLHGPGGTVLAPLYDLLSTVLYPGLSDRFAMRIGRARRLEALRPGDWVRFAARTGLELECIRWRMRALAANLYAALEPSLATLLGKGLDDAALVDQASLVRSRTSLCISSLG